VVVFVFVIVVIAVVVVAVETRIYSVFTVSEAAEKKKGIE
jgi:hypothetical protein